MEQEFQNHTDALNHGEVDALTDPPIYDDEHSFCNCENNECITPYKSDSSICEDLCSSDQPDEERTIPSMQASTAAAPTQGGIAQRLKSDLLAARRNPYIQREHSCRIHLYRKKGDTEPIDSFEANTTHSFSARALLLLGGAILTVCLMKRMLEKKP